MPRWLTDGKQLIIGRQAGSVMERQKERETGKGNSMKLKTIKPFSKTLFCTILAILFSIARSIKFFYGIWIELNKQSIPSFHPETAVFLLLYYGHKTAALFAMTISIKLSATELRRETINLTSSYHYSLNCWNFISTVLAGYCRSIGLSGDRGGDRDRAIDMERKKLFDPVHYERLIILKRSFFLFKLDNIVFIKSIQGFNWDGDTLFLTLIVLGIELRLK